MKVSKKSLAVAVTALVILLVLIVAAVFYFQPNVNRYLFSAAGLSKEELKKGFIATISDGKTEAVSGELVTYTFTFKHNLADSAFEKFSPVFGVEVKEIEVHNISDGGTINNEVILWEPVEMGYGQTVKHTFQIIVPSASFGDKYCVNAGVGAMAVLPITIAGASDCTKIISKASIKKPTPQPAQKTPTPTQLPPTPQATKLPVSTAVPQATPTPTTTNPIDPDGDGLPSDQEVVWGSDPWVFDTDGDGAADGEEVRQGTNPAGDAQVVVPQVQKQPQEIEPIAEQSLLESFTSGVTGRWRTITKWFAKLF